MLSTRLLAQFVAVAEELHFGRAAARMHMSQSPLSHAIKKLEEGLGVALFIRSKRSVALTTAGEVLLHRARSLMHSEDATVSMVRHAQKHGREGLSIGFVGNVAYGLVPQLLWRFREAHPHVHLDISEMLTRDLLGSLQAGQLDVGFVRPPFQGPDSLSSHVVGIDRFVVALPSAQTTARSAAIALADLSAEPFVAYSIERVPVLHGATVALCLQAGFYPNIVCQAWQASSILSFVAAGVGVALVPSDLQVFQHAGVAYRRLSAPHENTELKISAVWRPNNESPSLTAFLDLVCRSGGSAPASDSIGAGARASAHLPRPKSTGTPPNRAGGVVHGKTM